MIQIKFKNEKQDLITYETDKITGVFWDEASVEDIFSCLIPRLADKLGFMLLSTLSAYFWLKTRICLSSNKNYYHRELSIYDNEKNLTKEGIASFDDLPELEKKVRKLGEFAVEEGLVFPVSPTGIRFFLRLFLRVSLRLGYDRPGQSSHRSSLVNDK